MHLKVGVVAVIVAAAAGAAAGRATAPHVPRSLATSTTANAAPAGMAFGASGVSTGDAATAFPDGYASASRSARGRFGGAEAGGGGGASSTRGTQAVLYVAGAVARPGVYTLRAAARADDALRAAGGATAAADLVAINLAARVEDGEEIAVPVKGAETTVSDGATTQAKKRPRRHAGKRGHRRKRHRQSEEGAGGADASSTTDAPPEMVDVNAADETSLETLPGVGPSLAQRIIAFRDLNGPFASPDELLDVGGMTAGKVDALSPYVTFH